MPQQILITGGAGFIASHLADELLRSGHRVRALDNLDPQVHGAGRDRPSYLDEDIMSLPNGYDTVIGDRGGRLSGGQRQRLALARALLKDAPVLVLDEATSALDAMSESVVQDALARLREDRTTLVVAHRLSTVVDADRIVVLKDGALLAQGRHDDLLRDCSYYASLVGASTDGLLQVA